MVAKTFMKSFKIGSSSVLQNQKFLTADIVFSSTDCNTRFWRWYYMWVGSHKVLEGISVHVARRVSSGGYQKKNIFVR